MLYKIKLKRPESKTSSLMATFMKNGVSYKFYTGKTIHCKNWSDTKQEVLSKEENHNFINQYLDDWKLELKKIIAEMEAKKERLNKDLIQAKLDKIFNKDILVNENQNEVFDLISFIEDFINRKNTKLRNTQKYKQTKKIIIIAFNLASKNKINEWNKLGSKKKSITELKSDYKLRFEDVNLKLIEKFRDYMFTATFTTKIKSTDIKQHYKINYIDKQVSNLKYFITEAIEAGYIQRFTWNGIKSERKDVDSIYTDFTEIQTLNNLQLEKKTEILVRDKYVLNCFLGMRYSDLNKLEPHLFSKQEIKGIEYSVYTGRAKKTDHKIEFALHPIAQEILKKYDYNIPTLSAKEFNDVLKIIAYKAGLTGLERIREIRGNETIIKDVPKYELMSSHAGRRSFCTNFYNEGIAIAAIMSISGHQTESEFRKYIKKASVRLEIVAEQISAIKGINHLKVA
jgi:hypothetical protein